MLGPLEELHDFRTIPYVSGYLFRLSLEHKMYGDCAFLGVQGLVLRVQFRQ